MEDDSEAAEEEAVAVDGAGTAASFSACARMLPVLELISVISVHSGDDLSVTVLAW